MMPRLRLLVVLAPLVLGRCSQPTTVTGGGSVIGNPPIASVLKDQAGRPVPFARVSLYKADHNPVSGDTATEVARADSSGRFLFDSAPAGAYNIVAAVQEGRFMGMVAQVIVPTGKNGDTVRAPDCVVGDPAAISIPLADKGFAVGDFLYLPGTPVYRRIDSAAIRAGWINLEPVPAGAFPILYHARTAGGAPRNILEHPVTVSAGDTALAGPYQAWKQTRKVFINAGAGGADLKGTIRAFPLLVRLDSTTFDFNRAGDTGQDVRFMKADGITPLPYHIVRWGRADCQIWVRLDSIRAGEDSQFIYLLSGRDSVPSQSDAGAVFDTADGFSAVWHLGDDPAGQPPAYLDATRSGNHGYGMGMTSETRVEGVIGRAAALDGKSQYIRVPDAENLRPGAFSFSAWIKADTLGGRIFDKISVKGVDGYSFDTFGGHIRVCGAPTCFSAQSQLPTGRFVHVAATWEGGALRFFLNGIPDGATDSLLAVPVNGFDLRIGATRDGTENFRGIIDEAQISRTARSADWIRLSYENQKPGSRIVSIR